MLMIKLYGSNFLFLSINTPPSRHAVQSMHVACDVCMPWLATLSFSSNKSLLVTKYLDNTVSVDRAKSCYSTVSSQLSVLMRGSRGIDNSK